MILNKSERMKRPCKVCAFGEMECGDMGYDSYRCYFNYKPVNWEMYYERGECSRNITFKELNEVY